jgi:hypothetical protein
LVVLVFQQLSATKGAFFCNKCKRNNVVYYNYNNN